MPPPPIDWEAVKTALEGIETIADRNQCQKLSSDYHTFSPILVPQLADKVADLVVRPANAAEVRRVAQVCAQWRVPLTMRGAGTGNYGQCVPLAGGIVLDMTGLNQVLWVEGGVVGVEAGAKLAAIDKITRPQGWELRMIPSTYRTATIGGFIAGGSGGIGSITYGQLRDRGNVLALKVMTVEEEPRLIELRGREVQKVNHAWGINGIITEVELALAPVYPWVDVVVSFADFMQAVRFSQRLSQEDGLVKKLVSTHAWPIPSYFTALRPYLAEGSHCVLLIVAAAALRGEMPGGSGPLQDLVADFGGTIVYQKSAPSKTHQASGKSINLIEYTWNHTTLHARTLDPNLTYLQTLFPADPGLRLIEHLYHHFGDEVMMHLEFIRVNGTAIAAGLQLVRFTTADRLAEIIRDHEDHGVFVANPHTYIIEDGGRKQMDPQQMAFKTQVDPYGLCNPGKTRALG